MGGLFAIVVLVSLGVLVFRLVAAHAGTRDAAWQEAADQLGLRFQPRRASPLEFWRPSEQQHRSMLGSVDGVPVRVHTFWQGSGDNRTTYTGFWAGYPPLGLGLAVYREGAFGRLWGRLTGRDVEVGDAEFDQAHRVEGAHPERVAAFLTPSRRVTIDRLLAELDDARVGDDGIIWRKRGVMASTGDLVGTVRRLAAAAGAIAGGQPAVDEALERQRRGDLAEAAERMRVAARRSGDVETRRTEGETLYAAGRYAESAEAFEELERRLPVDDQVRRWRELAAGRRDEAAVPPRLDVAADTDPGPIADELFDPRRLSFETAKVFAEQYEGLPVRWRGILVRTTPYRSDLDFRTGPGTKAVIRVHTLANDLYAGRDVEAVVQLPAAAHERLAGKRGEEVRFTGTLVRVDPLMRNLFVADGKLVSAGLQAAAPQLYPNAG